MSVRTESNQDIREQAAYWAAMLLNSGEALSQGELQRFHSWVAVPCNARAFHEYQSVVVMIQDLPRHQRATLEALAIPQPRFPGLSALFAHPVRLSAAALAFTTVVAIAAWFAFRPVREFATQTYTTDIGEERVVVLRDGSVAHLNTQSRLRWVGAGKERHVALERGEVLFHVAHDPTQPFLVTVGNSEIRDLATEFDVYRKSNGSVLVTVLSGQVVVRELTTGGAKLAWTERLIKANQQMEYTPATLISDVHAVPAAKTVLWREGLFEMEGQSFATIVGELNRYSSKQILVADPRIDATQAKFSGTLNIHDMPTALKHIQQLQPMDVTDTGDSYVLTYKGDVSATAPAKANQQNEAGH